MGLSQSWLADDGAKQSRPFSEQINLASKYDKSPAQPEQRQYKEMVNTILGLPALEEQRNASECVILIYLVSGLAKR